MDQHFSDQFFLNQIFSGLTFFFRLTFVSDNFFPHQHFFSVQNFVLVKKNILNHFFWSKLNLFWTSIFFVVEHLGFKIRNLKFWYWDFSQHHFYLDNRIYGPSLHPWARFHSKSASWISQKWVKGNQWREKEREKKKDRKSVLKMARYLFLTRKF